MMMLAETYIIEGAMDGYRHLSIAEHEDIMVRWKNHEGISQIAREIGTKLRILGATLTANFHTGRNCCGMS